MLNLKKKQTWLYLSRIGFNYLSRNFSQAFVHKRVVTVIFGTYAWMLLQIFLCNNGGGFIDVVNSVPLSACLCLGE